MSLSAVASVLERAAGVLILFVLMRQLRRPAWLPGRIIARHMNSSHYKLTTWGLSHLQVDPASVCLDVGCGGGRTIQQLALLAPNGKVHGIDYSTASVAVARQTNSAAIESGQVDIRHGSVSNLPFADDTFDLVTAVETLYYWPNLEADLREVRRVLRPMGRVAIIAEAYRGQRMGGADALAMRVLGGKLLSPNEHRDLLLAAGFADVSIFEDRQKGWLCVVGQKGASSAS